MEDQEQNKIEAAGELLERLTNVYGCKSDLSKLAVKMTRMHRTLVQSFTSGFIIPFVREMAKMKRSGCFDARNSAAVEACEEMCKTIESKYGISDGDEIGLPCI